MVAQNDGNCKIKPQLFAKREVRYYAQNIALDFVFYILTKNNLYDIIISKEESINKQNTKLNNEMEETTMTRTLTHRHLRPWIAFLLSAILLIQSTLIFSFHVSAENESTEEPTIVAEDVTKRTENEKHFLCSDGSMMAVSYARPVHYEKDGAWEEIDNQLEYISKENAYVTRNGGGFDVRFEGNGAVTAQNANGFLSWTVGIENTPTLVTMQYDQTAPFSVETSANKVNATANIKAAAKIDYKGKSVNDLSLGRVEKNHTEISFSSAFGNFTSADVKYSLAPGMVKEDVIFERKSTASKIVWTLTLSEGATAELQKDGSVLLYNGENIIYCTIGAPYMYDNAGEEGSVQTTLTKVGDTWRLVYHLDTAWMQSEEREYPVTFDPPVYNQTIMGNGNFYDTCYNIADANDTTDYASATTLHVGSYSSINNYFTHIRFLRYSSFNAEYNEITNVNLRMYTNQYKDAVSLYRVGANETVNRNYRLASGAQGTEGVYTSTSNTSGYFTFALDKDVYIADMLAYQSGALRPEDKGYTIWPDESDRLAELHSCESFYYPPSLIIRYRAKNLGGKAVMLKNTQMIEGIETTSYLSVGSDDKVVGANKTSAEVFILNTLDNGCITIESYLNRGRYLQYDGTDVIVAEAPSDNSYYWGISADADGYTLYNASDTMWHNRCLYLDGSIVKIAYSVPNESQKRWNLEDAFSIQAEFTDNAEFVFYNLASDQCLQYNSVYSANMGLTVTDYNPVIDETIASSSYSDGYTAQTREVCQRFKFEPVYDADGDLLYFYILPYLKVNANDIKGAYRSDYRLAVDENGNLYVRYVDDGEDATNTCFTFEGDADSCQWQIASDDTVQLGLVADIDGNYTVKMGSTYTSWYVKTICLNVIKDYQRDNNTCGTAAGAMVLKYFNVKIENDAGVYVDIDEGSFKKYMQNKYSANNPGVDLGKVKVSAMELINQNQIDNASYTVKWENLSDLQYLNRISNSLNAGHPVIVYMRSFSEDNGYMTFGYESDGHYIVVKGIVYNSQKQIYEAVINDCHYEFGPNTNGKYPANKCNDIGGRDAVVDVQDLIKAMRRGGYHQDPDASLHGNQCMMYYTNA